MDQVRQSGSRFVKSRFRKRFIGSGQNAVARRTGVQDYADIAFRHVATYAIVRRLVLLSHPQRGFAAAVGMASSTLSVEVRKGLLSGRLLVRIVAGNATKPTSAASITLAENHGVVVLEVIR